MNIEIPTTLEFADKIYEINRKFKNKRHRRMPAKSRIFSKNKMNEFYKLTNYLRKQMPVFILSEIQKNKGVIRPSINVFEISINLYEDDESTEKIILDSLADLDGLPENFESNINIVRRGKYYRCPEGYLRSINLLRWRLNRQKY